MHRQAAPTTETVTEEMSHDTVIEGLDRIAPLQPRPLTRKKSRVLFFFSTYAEVLNLVGPWWGLFTMLSCTYFGFSFVLPDVYAGWPDWWHSTLTTIVWFLLIETSINWFFLRFVNNDVKLQQFSQSELQLLARKADAAAVELQNPSNRPLKTDDCNSDVMMSLNTQKLCAVQMSSDGRNRVKMYPYMSWRPCMACGIYRPPRAHHCPLCRKCVLKRDHHCFFSGSCVGLYNQRFFLVFTFYVMVLAYIALFHALLYIYLVIWEESSLYDLVLPLTVLRWAFSMTEGINVLYVSLLYSLIFMSAITTNFFSEHCDMIMAGWTSYEKENDIKVMDTRCLEGKLMSVLGKHWWLAFILPNHKCNPVKDDGFHWPTLKVINS